MTTANNQSNYLSSFIFCVTLPLPVRGSRHGGIIAFGAEVSLAEAVEITA